MEQQVQRAQIGPTNELLLLRNIPLDPTYVNTLYFDNATAQENYFKGKVKYVSDNITGMTGNAHWTELTYIRRTQNTVRIQVNADKIMDCNYIMFRNTNFGTKWFYGFITETNYINDTTTEIVWELDVMQTWFFDFSLAPCFVERIHYASDVLGKPNHTPEPVALGDYWTYAKGQTTFSNNVYVVVVTSSIVKSMARTAQQDEPEEPESVPEQHELLEPDLNFPSNVLPNPPSGDDNLDKDKPADNPANNPGSGDGDIINASGLFYTGIYSGLAYFSFIDANEVNAYLSKLDEAGKADSVVSIFMAPKSFYKRGRKTLTSAQADVPKLISTFPHDKYRNKVYGSFVPKNNKLFQYPYCYLRVSNNAGQNQNLWFEDWDGTPTLEFSCATTPTPEIICSPRWYNGESYCASKKVVVSGFPQCAWTSDAYKAYLAQRNSSLAFDMTTDAVGRAASGAFAGATAGGLIGSVVPGAGTAIGAIGGAILGAGGSLLSNITKTVSNDMRQSIEPPITHGTTAPGTDFARGILDFSITARGLHPQEAKVADDFFTMFGYSANQVFRPSINVRPHFTFVKTQGCNIKGSIPGQDAQKICQIFDNGVTHWRYPDEVGDYSVDNRPASRERAIQLDLDLDGVEYESEEQLAESEKQKLAQ